MSDPLPNLTRRERISLWFIVLALDTIGAFKFKSEWKELSEDLRKELRDG
jgi:hypothetical protein